jgi:hypothetical protein
MSQTVSILYLTVTPMPDYLSFTPFCDSNTTDSIVHLTVTPTQDCLNFTAYCDSNIQTLSQFYTLLWLQHHKLHAHCCAQKSWWKLKNKITPWWSERKPIQVLTHDTTKSYREHRHKAPHTFPNLHTIYILVAFTSKMKHCWYPLGNNLYWKDLKLWF